MHKTFSRIVSRFRLATVLAALIFSLPTGSHAVTFNNWSSSGPTITSARVSALTVTSSTASTAYAGTDGGGIVTMAAAGSSWSSANAGLSDRRIRAIVTKPGFPLELFAATSHGVFKSLDGGANWSAVNNGLTTADVSQLVIDPSSPAVIYAATNGGGIFKSTDSAVTWSAANSGLTDPNVRAICLDPSTPALYAGTATGVFKSTNGGGSWVAGNTGLTSTDMTSLAFAATTPTATLFAGTSGGGVFFSTDGAASWSADNTGLTNLVMTALVIDPTTPNTAYAGTNNGLFRRTFGGGTWSGWVRSGSSDITNPVVRAIAVDPAAPATIFAGTDGGLFRSTNSGTAWASVNNGLLQGRSVAVKPGDATNLASSFSGGGVFLSSNRGTSWSQPVAGPSNQFVTAILYDPYTAGNVYAGTGGGVFRSTDNGANWSDITGNLATTDVRALAIDPVAPHNLHAGTGTGVYAWDGIATWTGYNGATLGNKDVTSLAFRGTTLLAGTNGGGVYRSDSGGAWAQKITGLGSTVINALLVDAATGDIYAGTAAGVHKSTDIGNNWNAVNSGISSGAMDIRSLALNSTTPPAPATVLKVVAAGSAGGGVFVSTSGGSSWTGVNSRLADLQVNGLAIDADWPQYVHAATATKLYDIILSPTLQVAPLSGQDFGPANIISAPSSQEYTITNAGPLDLTISGLSVTAPAGTSPAYLLGGTTPCTHLPPVDAVNLVLPAGASCNFLFQFTPQVVGAGNATLTFTSNDASSPSSSIVLNWSGVDPPPTSVITAPVTGTAIRTPATITGTAADIGSGLLKVQVSINGGAWQDATGTGSWSYSWSPPADGSYTIRSQAIDNATPANTQSTPYSVTVNVDNTVPAAAIASPSNNAALHGTSVTISGTASDPVSPGSGIRKIELSTDGGSSWQDASGTTSWSYSWTLPVDGTYSLQARATDNAGNQALSGPISVRVDNTPPTVAISTPASGATLPVGTSYTITGSAGDSGSGIRLVEVSADNGTTWQTANYAAGSWSYPWTVPVNGTYQLLARATDVAGNTGTTPAQTVVVSNPLPSSTIGSPANGAFLNGPNLAVSGTAVPGNPALGLSRVEVSVNGGGWQAASGTSPWTITVPLPSSYIATFPIQSRSVDGIGNIQSPTTDIVVTVDNAKPVTAVTSPLTGAYLRGATYSVTGTASDVGLGVQRVELSFDGGSNWHAATGTTTWSYSWSLPVDGAYTITARAFDNIVGNESVRTTIPVTVDNTPPITTLTGKPANPSNAPKPPFTFSAGETASFSCTLDGTTSPCTSPFTPPQRLPAGSHTFSVQATDLAGNVETSPPTYIWSVDLVPPIVTAVTPTDRSERISVSGQQITAKFSKDLDPTTVTTSSFTLTSETGTPLAGTVSYDMQSRTATFIPTGELDYTTTYTATLNGIADPAGNRLPPYGWSFSTDPDGDYNLDGRVDIADALECLKVAVGRQTPTADQLRHGDVGPLKDGRPLPDKKIDISDAVVILEKVIGISAW